MSREGLLGWRYLWLDGLFSAVSASFYGSFVPLFALAYGASNSQVGRLTAIASLAGVAALFPGARVVEWTGKRKPVVVVTGGGIGRLILLAWACLPFFTPEPRVAVLVIIALNGLLAFVNHFHVPAWMAMVADMVPHPVRGRYFGSRNMAMGVAALVVVPVAGWLIHVGNEWMGMPFWGYQMAFFLAFVSGVAAAVCFQRIPEPLPAAQRAHGRRWSALIRSLGASPAFLGLVIGALVWNFSVNVAAPFFNVYLVSQLGASTSTVGVLTGITSLFSLGGQRLFGRLLDRKGAFWVQRSTGLLIPILPLSWIFVTAPWQVVFISAASGLLWAGYNLANFSLLLELTPDDRRPDAVALYQTVAVAGGVLGPLLGGYLADAVGFKAAFGISGAGRMLGILLFLYLASRPALGSGRRALVSRQRGRAG